MHITVEDIMDYMENLAPSRLKESYDNVGLMVGDRYHGVKAVLFCLDCTLEVIKEAKDKNVDMIISHHPLIFRKPSSITTDTLQGKKIIELIKNNINLYSSHTNLDSVKSGMNDTMVELLNLDINSVNIIEESSTKIQGAGIGRIIELKSPIRAEKLCSVVKEKFNLSSLRFAGELNMNINKIAIINGSGQDYFETARKAGAQCVITGDTTYHYISDYKEMGLFLIDIGHFSSEWPLFKIIGRNIEKYLKSQDEEIKVYYSQSEREPYEIF